MNYIPQIAEMLGVEMGEEFDIVEGGSNPYRFTSDGLVGIGDTTTPYAMSKLLTGEYTIQKRPWKPKEDDHYLYYDKAGYLKPSVFYSYSTFDHYNVTYGNCFPTEREAKANKDKALKALGLTEWVKE